MENREGRVKNAISTVKTAPLLALLSSYVSEVWNPLCTAGRTGTFLPLISTPDSLFHISAFLGTFTVTDTVSALQDLHQTSKETPLKEFLALSRTKIHPPDLMRQSYI